VRIFFDRESISGLQGGVQDDKKKGGGLGQVIKESGSKNGTTKLAELGILWYFIPLKWV
jgi:hypothetical protein